jgi:hypothetical protein
MARRPITALQANLATRINETHALAIQHAGQALIFAIRCGELLLKAKASIPHGQWLPWLRANVEFSERSAQGYMRVAQRMPDPQRVADMPLRRVLSELRTPLHAHLESMLVELKAWLAETPPWFADDPGRWSLQQAEACITNIKAFDEIMHRYGICPDLDNPEPCCTVCPNERDE